MTTHNERDTASKAIPGHHGYLNGWNSVFLFTNRGHLPVLLPAIFLSAAAGILQPAMALYFGKFFDTFSDFALEKIDGPAFMARALVSIYALLAIGVAAFVFKGSLFSFWLVFGELQARSIRELLFQSLLDREVEWYELRTNGVGTLLARMQTQIREMQLGTSQPLGFAIVYLIQALSSIILATRTNWKLTFVVLSVIPIIAIGVAVLSRHIQVNIDRQNERLEQSTALANNALVNIVTVKCFNTQEQEEQKYSSMLKEAARFSLRQAFFNAMQSGFIQFISTAMFVQGFWYGGIQVHSGKTSTGKVVTTFWACLIATRAFEDIIPHIIVLQRAQTAAVALKAVLDKVSSGKSHIRKIDGLSPQFCEGDIELRSVSFAYASRDDQLVLDRCTLYFPGGETTYVVGKSGSGKSTLSNILLRFYPPQKGSVLIDGNDIQAINTTWLRNNITLVQQTCVLFGDTVFRNVALGRQDYDRVTLDQVIRCLKMASLENTITQLPEGVRTRVGTGGSSLSGGQKQRIAIARARLRDTPILILDEATSALDRLSKTAVVEAIRRWRRGKTTIIITHDLEPIQAGDFVYVLDEGHIIQEGRRREIPSIQETLAAAPDRPNLADGPASPTLGKPERHFRSLYQVADASLQSELLVRRRDSFDVETEAVSSDHRRKITQNTDPSANAINRVMKGLSVGTGAAMKVLKRQSMARAKAMYSIGLNKSIAQAAPSFSHSIVKDTIPVPPTPRTSRTPFSPFFRHKPLPMPPPPAENLGLVQHPDGIELAEDVAHSGERRPPSSIPTILATIWPMLSNSGRGKLLVGFIATIAHAGAPPAFGYALVQVFNTYYIPTGYERRALAYSMVVLGIAVADGIACFLMHYLLESASQLWVDKLRNQAMQRILRQPKGWFDQEENNPGSLVSTLDSNADEIKDLVGRFAAQLLTLIVMMVVGISWSLITCWKITLVSLAATPALYFLAKCFERISSLWESRTNSASDLIGEIFVEAFADIKTVRSLTLESYLHKKYHGATRQAFSIGTRRAIFSGFFFGLSDSALNFFTPMIFWYGARLAKDQEWPVKSIFIVFGLLLFCTANATGIVSYIPQVSSAVVTASLLLQLANMSPLSHEDVGQFQLNREDPGTLSGPIHFVNLTFSYPKRPETPALQQLNLTIPSGRCTAIVGVSGSGKSTITSLILGLYPPAADGIPSLTISGRDIHTLDIHSLRSLVSIVPQTPVLLPTTVRENITYGLPLDSPHRSASQIEAAAQAAGIHEFIQSLPQGYATVIGGGAGGGLSVSGGQAQRIVIARALVRDPKILILDEATSALDHASADVIRESVKRLIRDKKKRRNLTVIVVTHAREMMEFADHVVVLEKGNVVEEGGFQELLRKRKKLWDLVYADADSE